MKHALVLGAGLVSQPLIKYLIEKNIFVTAASRDFIDRDYLDSTENAKAVELDLNDNEAIEIMVSKSDIVISLLPYAFHVKIAKMCIKHKTNMLTASYVSDEMEALHEEAKEAGIIIMNEIGLDPGIDHMSAMQVIDEIKADGGELTSFISNCGGLPMWDAISTPFKYKFSWSPEGVVLAAKNSAQYLENGTEIKIPEREIFKYNKNYDLGQFGQYEVYPNRDSLKYIGLYGLEGIKTMYRGTFRNLGWCDMFTALMEIRLLDQEKEYDLKNMTFHEFMREHLGLDSNKEIKELVSKKLKLNIQSTILSKIEWLGLCSDEPIGLDKGTSFDIICQLLKDKLQYEDGERDLVILQHEFEANYPDRTEKRTSLLLAKGIKNGDSAMARTVGLPAAIASYFILEGKISKKGVQRPLFKEIYEPTLKELESYGITFLEKKTIVYDWH